MPTPTPGAGGRRDLFEQLQRDQAEMREDARRRRIREGGPEVSVDDLTIDELHELRRRLRERGEC